jgi:hypothetical protein
MVNKKYKQKPLVLNSFKISNFKRNKTCLGRFQDCRRG